MDKDEIYDHLARVYLGKTQEGLEAQTKKKQQFNSWLSINIFITFIIFASVFYGFTAFLTQQGTGLKNNIIYSLHKGIIRMNYNFKESYDPTKIFALDIPDIDASKYNTLKFSMRGSDEGFPGIVKVVFNNEKRETSYYYVQGVKKEWKEYVLLLDDFEQITDWTNLTDVSFVLESWNVDKKKGIVLIEDVNFTMVNVVN